MSTRLAVVLAAVASAAVVGVAALLLGPSASGAPAPVRPLGVRASFAPGAVEFGDTVTAQVVVTMDDHAVRESSLRVVYGVAPLTQLGRAVARHTTRGALSVATYELRAACLSDACIASSGRRSVAPSPVRADVTRRDGTHLSATAAWAPLVVSSRISPTDLTRAQPPFRADLTPPPPTYRTRPAVLAAALDGAALLLAACAAALVAAALLRTRRPRSEPARDELTRALALARAARNRPEPDRRTAAGYVARLLARRDERLAHTADELAWSRPAPSSDSLTELVEDVERERSS